MRLAELEGRLEADDPQTANDPIHQVGRAALSILKSHPDAVLSLAHEKLHAFHFSQVPTSWRRLYEEAALWKVVSLVRVAKGGWMDEVVGCLDMALILTGAPGRRSLIDSLLESPDFWTGQEGDSNQPPTKRRRISLNGESQHRLDSINATSHYFCSEDNTLEIPVVLSPISRIDQPSLSSFQKHAQQERTPIILTNTLSDWPALETWQSPQHWLSCTLGGRRLVPVEFGRSYTDEGWAQKIISFRQFQQIYLLGDSEHQSSSSSGQESAKGYLAQHDLLTQIPKLRSEVMIPDYCYIDVPKPEPSGAGTNEQDMNRENSDAEFTEPLLNIWLGPAGTISPCHTDPHHNILAQVVGRKYIRLYSPSETNKLYPMGGGKGEVGQESTDTNDSEEKAGQQEQAVNMSNTSRIDISKFLEYRTESENDREQQHSLLKQFPRFTDTKYVDCILEPGDCLYIPRGWWHFITSLDVSASVSFWWD